MLKNILKDLGNESATALHGDSNVILGQVKETILKDFKKPLILMFIDPFGEFSDQLSHKTVFKFTRDLQVDVIMNVNTPHLARGLEAKKKNLSDLKVTVENLWGDLCQTPQMRQYINICRCLEGKPCDITMEDILNAYRYRFEIDGYRFVDALPVEYTTGVIYHLLLASKDKHSYEWLGNYVNYLTTKAPKDYNTLKRLWLQATGKQKDLTKYI